MNEFDVAKIIGEMGYMIKRHIVEDMLDYFSLMLYDQRVILISDDKPCAILFISMTDQPESYLKKGDWEYRGHDPNGKIVYVEKLISTGWNKEMRQSFERQIIELYPQMEFGAYHRYAPWGDRPVISKRRINHGIRN